MLLQGVTGKNEPTTPHIPSPHEPTTPHIPSPHEDTLVSEFRGLPKDALTASLSRVDDMTGKDKALTKKDRIKNPVF